MKKKSFWSMLLFAGMLMVAGFGFNSCEQKSSGGSGGGGSDRDGGGGTVTDSLEHCWEIVYQYKGESGKDTAYVWATQKEIEDGVKESKSDSSYIAILSYNLSKAKTESECDAMGIDEYQKMCWEVTYYYYGQSYTEYVWTNLKELQEWEKEAAKDSMTMTYRQSWPDDEMSCEDLNQGGGSDTTYVQSYYIKHPWDGGSWAWYAMEYSDGTYYAQGYWGGTGANINTVADDSGADWYPESEIIGASDVYVGQYVEFVFNPPYSLSVYPIYY